MAVVLGTRDGAVIYDGGDWNKLYSLIELSERLFTRKAVAAWIEGVVCTGHDLSWRPQQ